MGPQELGRQEAAVSVELAFRERMQILQSEACSPNPLLSSKDLPSTPAEIAAELGSMVVTDQINALRALGTDPVRKLVVPRIVAGVLMAPVLTVISDFVGIVGGWMVARFQLQVASGLYWSSIVKALYMQDVWMGLIKPVVLGFVIVSIACHVGLRTSGGTQGVGKSTTVAVVAGSVGVIAVDFFVTRVLISLIY